jgi:two-component system sensor histidine kinase PilS (NtrC family)
MDSPESHTHQSELSERLQKLMFLRVLFVSLLLGASVFVQVKETRTYFGGIQTSHYLLIVAIYALTLFYIILLKHVKNLERLTYFQLLWDTAFVTAIIYATGGIDSIFSFLYILTIINGSIILYRKGGMIIASSSSILYGLLLDLHFYGVIHPFGSRISYSIEHQSAYILFITVVNIAAFYLVAFLSSYPSEQARKSRVELQAKQSDIVHLEALNERIIRSITSGLITLNDQASVILFNPAAESIFGISSHAAIGRNVLDVLPFLRGCLNLSEDSRDPAADKPLNMIDLPYRQPNGETMFLRLSISPLSLPAGRHRHRGRVLVFQDMTETKKIEEDMKRVEGLALVGELAAGIAHEIRNPLASISGSIQMLKEGLKIDDMNMRLMDITLREINRLNHLINDFLHFARPKPLDMREFDLNQLITESIEMFENRANWTDDHTVETEFCQPISLRSDPAQLKQVLWNLFLNARDAMPQGGALCVSTSLVEETDHHRAEKLVKITVRDTGEGFTEKALHHLFTPFFTTKENGSGLGLATVKRIVDRLKGQVYGQNNQDGGAEIAILLQPSLNASF